MRKHRSFVVKCFIHATAVITIWPLNSFGQAAKVAKQDVEEKIFGGARIEEIYRLRLERGDLLLESIIELIKAKNVQDGAVLTAAGSVQDCTFHGVKSLAPKPEREYKTVKGAVEILNVNGLIAAGEPHIHLTLANSSGAFGGHLEKNCKVLYLAELTVAKFAAPPLVRKPNAEGVGLLQSK